MKMLIEIEVYETSVSTLDDLTFRIQLRRVAGVWQQRHIWYPPTPYVDAPRADPWIRSVQFAGDPKPHYALTDNPDADIQPAASV